MKDLGRSESREARIILGAAVIDDVLGLVVLAVVSGVVVAADTGGHLSSRTIAAIVTKAIVFLIGSLTVGVYLSPRILRAAAALRSGGVLLAAGLSWCFLLAWLANAMGLASIVGAFAAGLILESWHSQMFVERGERALPELVHPISGFLVPVFFVVMGARADLRAFTDPAIMGLAAALTIAAIAGKQACSVAVMERGIDRLSVGIGSAPRGEVGLIFAKHGTRAIGTGRAYHRRIHLLGFGGNDHRQHDDHTPSAEVEPLASRLSWGGRRSIDRADLRVPS